MKLEKLAKSGASGDNGCPTVYLAEDGRLVIQGDLVDSATNSELENVLPGEGAVTISADVVVDAVARYLKR